ncbi:T-cell surface glycoprotein CD3 epsilon chain-like [Brachionichthys hirsutus]|uniref:T-cell surface glycoprotein CD3 epsilon chain-like n=1 Tax=Brachionichthys hirsutus TaxID=412623 RepID=UPI00360461D3
MSRSGVRAALALLLLAVPVEAGSGGVRFWRENVTMSCPGDGTWFSKEHKPLGLGTELEVQHQNRRGGFYYCRHSGGEYYFYIQGKACDGCFELDATSLGLVLIVDICVTAAVMMMVYRCTKTKTSASKGPSRDGGRGPVVPSPDYEYPNRKTRSQDIYSKMSGM